MIELAQAGGQLAAAGSGSRDHHQLPGGLDIIVLAEASVGDHKSGIGGVSLNGIVMIYLHPHALQSCLEGLGRHVVVIPGQYHTGDIEPEVPEDIDEPDHIQIVSNAQVSPNLVLLNIRGVDGNDHLHLVLQLQQHPELAVRLEAGKYPGRVVVIVKFAAELQIELAAELGDPLPDVAGLHL